MKIKTEIVFEVKDSKTRTLRLTNEYLSWGQALHELSTYLKDTNRMPRTVKNISLEQAR